MQAFNDFSLKLNLCTEEDAYGGVSSVRENDGCIRCNSCNFGCGFAYSLVEFEPNMR